MNDLISVIIPAYNSDKTIRKCLESVLSQSYEELEVIVIDDGSTDKTSDIVRSIMDTDSRICYFHKNNGGQSSARNLGLKNLSGKYFTFVDSDDYIKPEMILRLYSLIIEKKADISMCGYSNICNNKIEYLHCDNIEIAGCDNVIKALLTEKIMAGPVCKLFSAKMFSQIQFQEGIIFEDIEYLSRVFLKVNKIVSCNYAGYVYVIHPESTTHSLFSKKHYDLLKVTDTIVNRITLTDFNCSKEIQCLQLTHYITFLNYVWGAKAQSKEKENIDPLINWMKSNLAAIMSNNCISLKKKIAAIIYTINISCLNKLFVYLK